MLCACAKMVAMAGVPHYDGQAPAAGWPLSLASHGDHSRDQEGAVVAAALHLQHLARGRLHISSCQRFTGAP